MTIYVADPPAMRVAVALEALVAVYHVPSGMTHLLAPPAPEMLEALGEGPADADAIMVRLMRSHCFDELDARAALSARLDELEASGLVWRA